MNKIKIIYDAVKKMKDREVFKGVFTAEGVKDETKVFHLNNVFERNHRTGKNNGKMNMEVECEGKKMKLENNIDMESGWCHRPHGSMHPFHAHHHFACHPPAYAIGMKDGFDKITAVLGILSSIQMDEGEDGSAILSLKSTNLPEEIKKAIQEKMQQGCQHPHQHRMMGESPIGRESHAFLKAFYDMDPVEFTLCIRINREREMEKVTLEAISDKKESEKASPAMKLTAELNLEW